MVFLIGGANSAADTGYDIENSLRIEKGDSAYLSDALSSPNTDIFTLSMWLKIVYNDANTTFCEIGKTLTGEAGSNTTFNPHIGYGRIAFNAYDGVANAYRIRWGAPGSFRYRDSAAWYHVVARMDSSQAVAASRARFYINGEDISSKLTHTTDPDQNDDYFNATGSSIYFGGANIGGGGYWDGYMADVAYIDGTSYAPGTFAETDEDSGIWKPKDFKDDVTWGTNGIFLEFKQSGTGTNASGLGADTSGNDNHMAVTNLAATDQTTDTPTNNFAILNQFMTGRGSTLTEGNLKVSGESDNNYDVATFGSDMKWYYEWKVDENYDGSGGGIRLGAIHEDELATNDNFSNFANATAKFYTNSNDGKTQDGAGTNVTTGLTRATTNDIIMCACDGAGAKIWWGVNGTWLDYGSGTGDPAAGSNAATWTTAMKAGIWFPATVYSGTAAAGTLNLGNPPNAISSSQADDAGYGNFEYDVPAGFYALCTKNLAEYG